MARPSAGSSRRAQEALRRRSCCAYGAEARGHMPSRSRTGTSGDRVQRPCTLACTARVVPTEALALVSTLCIASCDRRCWHMRTQAARACERLNSKVNSSSGASAQALAEEMAVVVYDVPTAASECARVRARSVCSAGIIGCIFASCRRASCCCRRLLLQFHAHVRTWGRQADSAASRSSKLLN